MATPPSAKVHEFDVAVGRDGSSSSGLGGVAVPASKEWWAEHLVLAGLVRCTLTSLRYHARHAGLHVEASGRAHGTVTRRKDDGLYGFVDIESELEVELDPAPGPEAVEELVAKAERGCFVGNSLVPKPRYRWTVNGEAIE
jgi:organic hydroperoxide reductase OsmC/OhrA